MQKLYSKHQIAQLTRSRVKSIIDGRDPVFGRLFEKVSTGLIVLSAISLAVETISGLPHWLKILLWLEEVAIVILFSAEYILRIWTSEKPIKYIVSFWGVVDILAIAPFYLSMGIDLRGLRIIRLLRLFRLLKALRYIKAANRLRSALQEIRDELVIFACLSSIVLYLSAVGIYHFEHSAQPEKFTSIPQSLWWSIATLTTVGYGDVYPITVGGQLFTSVVLLGSRLNQIQNAMRVANATADRKFLASLS